MNMVRPGLDTAKQYQYVALASCSSGFILLKSEWHMRKDDMHESRNGDAGNLPCSGQRMAASPGQEAKGCL